MRTPTLLLAALAFAWANAWAAEPVTAAGETPEPRSAAQVRGNAPPAEESRADIAAALTPETKPVPRRAIIAILPLKSPALTGAATAVKAGIERAARIEQSAIEVKFVAAEDEAASLVESYREADRAGALVIVGGLTRDGASRMAADPAGQSATLLLNTPDNARDLQRGVFYLSLGLEQEVEQVVQAARTEGRRRAMVLACASPLAKRAQATFEKEWRAQGGEVATAFAVSADTKPLARLRGLAQSTQADVAFIACDHALTRTVKPYLPNALPVYSTALTPDDRNEPMAQLDLDGLRFLDMPWMVQADHPAVAVYKTGESLTRSELARLYAVGIDAFRLAHALARTSRPTITLDGVSGRIVLEYGNHFTRELTLVEFREGRLNIVRAP